MSKVEKIMEMRKKAHTKLLGLNSKTYRAFLSMEKVTYSDGKISKKIKELIALGISVVINCKSCMEWHTKEAVRSGATAEEILEVLEVSMEMGGGPATANARFALEVMETVFSK